MHLVVYDVSVPTSLCLASCVLISRSTVLLPVLHRHTDTGTDTREDTVSIEETCVEQEADQSQLNVVNRRIII